MTRFIQHILLLLKPLLQETCITLNMSTTATATTQTHASASSSGTLHLRPQNHVQPSPATPGFPITTDLQSSPFYDIQVGPTRTVMPTFGSLLEERQYRKEHLALVFRILHRFKMAEGIAGELDKLFHSQT
jgi:hypothetical protein